MANFFPNPTLRGILLSHLRSVFDFKSEFDGVADFDELIEGVPSEYAVALLDGKLFNPVELFREFYVPWLVGLTVEASKELESLPKPVQGEILDRFGLDGFDFECANEFLGPDSVLRLFHEFVHAGAILEYSDYCIDLTDSLPQSPSEALGSQNIYVDINSLLHKAMVNEDHVGNFVELFPFFYNQVEQGWNLLIYSLSVVSVAPSTNVISPVMNLPLSTRFEAILELYGSMVERYRGLTVISTGSAL